MSSEENFILSGPKMDLSGRDEYLGEFIYKSIKNLPMDTVFQVNVDRNESMTIGELYTMAIQICQGLLKRGLQKYDIVSLAVDNCNQLHASFLGILWAGGIPHPLNPTLKLLEMQPILQQVQPSWVFCDEWSLDSTKTSLNNLNSNAKVVLLNAQGDNVKDHLTLEDILIETDVDNFSPQLHDSPSDIAIILCSSGTMGIPKGVGLTHRNVLYNVYLWEHMPEMDVKKPLLLTSSFAWITGVYFLIMSTIYGCFRVITTQPNPDCLLKSIQDYKLHGAMLAPSIIKCILDSPNLKKYDLSSLKQLYTGGSSMAKHTVEKFLKEMPDTKLYQIYGLTELGGMITMVAPNHNPLSVGQVLYNTEVKVIDVENRKALGPNIIGEICIRSAGIFKTYVGNDAAAQETIENGWVCTGDLGYYSDEKQLFITARIKEIIKCQNNQVSPVELENYMSSLPGVADVGVAAIDCGEDGHLLMGIVKKVPGSPITADDIAKNVEENFSASKHLRAGVSFVDSLPRSISGKIRRKELNDLAHVLYAKGLQP